MRYLPFVLFVLLVPFFTGCLYHELPHKILIESDPPGARVELNQDYIGDTPLEYTIFGGHNHAFSKSHPTYTFRATPVGAGYTQTKTFHSETEDQIPARMMFNMRIAPAAGKDSDVEMHLDLKSHESK